jgi:hypothetical protein
MAGEKGSKVKEKQLAFPWSLNKLPSRVHANSLLSLQILCPKGSKGLWIFLVFSYWSLAKCVPRLEWRNWKQQER